MSLKINIVQQYHKFLLFYWYSVFNVPNLYSFHKKRIVSLNSKAFTIYLAVYLLSSKTLIYSFSLCIDPS